ncbi:MAG: hypothetical protein KDA05_08015 [Phycisphaerales bacterium]|nr:hypothetical protein [Phycisphaerales bacterium]
MSIRTIAAIIGLGAIGTAANAQLFVPNSATATSEFDSRFDIGNTFDGSGLPAPYTTADPHATYSSHNHWTTRAFETIGESATFAFDPPRAIGTFHMWNHRSNGIASNPHYDVIEFDMVLRDGGNAVLLERTCQTAYEDIEIAQTYRFAPVANVASVQFIVRATANNNFSPYTGLAEVAFEADGADCPADLTRGAVAGQPCYGSPDGKVNNNDFFYFLAQYAAANLGVCDLTTGAIPGQPGYGVPNGVLNNEDFFYYLTIFSAGC